MTTQDTTLEYLGDGLYVSFDGFQLCLKANDAENPTDTVYLERRVWEALTDYVNRRTANHD